MSQAILRYSLKSSHRPRTCTNCEAAILKGDRSLQFRRRGQPKDCEWCASCLRQSNEPHLAQILAEYSF